MAIDVTKRNKQRLQQYPWIIKPLAWQLKSLCVHNSPVLLYVYHIHVHIMYCFMDFCFHRIWAKFLEWSVWYNYRLVLLVLCILTYMYAFEQIIPVCTCTYISIVHVFSSSCLETTIHFHLQPLVYPSAYCNAFIHE